MKARILVAILMAIVSVFVMNGPGAQAQAPGQAVAGSVVFDLFAAISAGDMDSAMTTFAESASLGSRVNSTRYLGAEQIAAQLEDWHRDGRQYRVLQESIITLARGLNVVFSEVEVSDSGLVWGLETIESQVYNGRIQRLDVTGIRLIPIPYWGP
jgi:hypothetical protein